MSGRRFKIPAPARIGLIGLIGLLLLLAGPPLGMAGEGKVDREERENDVLSEWRAWREDELRQLAIRRRDAERFSRSSPEALREFRPAVEKARKSAVELFDAEGKRLCFGVAVDAAGHVLTKASEAVRAKDALRCRFPGGITVAARIADTFEPYDLAIVRVDASGLQPVTWAPAAALSAGTLVAAAGLEEDPLAIGVVSVESRSLNPGFLGIQVAETEGAALIQRVLPESAAEAAGVQNGDIVLRVEGEEIGSGAELIAVIKRYFPGDEVVLSIKRNEAELSLTVTLLARNAVIPPVDPNAEMLDRMKVPLSRNRTGFPSAVQHDLTLAPNQCGGLLVDMDGNAIGLNIARAGRVSTFAIPASDLVPLLESAADGVFSIPDPDTIRGQLEDAREAVNSAAQALDKARQQEAEMARALENLKKYRLPREGAPRVEEADVAESPGETGEEDAGQP